MAVRNIHCIKLTENEDIHETEKDNQNDNDIISCGDIVIKSSPLDRVYEEYTLRLSN